MWNHRLDFRLSHAALCVFFLAFSMLSDSSSGFVLPHSRNLNNLHRLSLSANFQAEDDVSIRNNGGSYIRWKTRSDLETSSDVWELQTAVTTFQKFNPSTDERSQVQLHAQVHMANQDYFDFYSSPEFAQQQDEVLYELLVDDELLGLSPDKSGRVVTEKLQASGNDEAVARDYGWTCQVNSMDYTQPKWKHADFSRQELLEHRQIVGDDRPLWEQIQSSRTSLWQPAISALLVGPPSLFVSADSTTTSKRKLFTNLFLPGNQLTGWLRATLWMTVPAPEISVLLLDWSSLFLSKSSGAQFSPVTLPILQSLMTLKIAQLRQLVFGQVLVSGNSGTTPSQQQDSDWNLLVTQRNDHALRVLKSSLNSPSNKKQIALLYGCSHCPDLHEKLVRDLGFSPVKTEWRTAWSVSVPKTFEGGTKGPAGVVDKSKELSSPIPGLYSYLPPTAWAALVALFPFYLGVGAVDWIDTIHSSSVSLLDHQDQAAFVADWFLYLLRHVLLYIGISKFALEWKEPSGRGG